MSPAALAAGRRALDLRGSDGNAVAVDQHPVGRRMAAIHEDQVVARRFAGHLALEELANGGAFRNRDLIGKAGVVVVDVGDVDWLSHVKTPFRALSVLVVHQENIQVLLEENL